MQIVVNRIVGVAQPKASDMGAKWPQMCVHTFDSRCTTQDESIDTITSKVPKLVLVALEKAGE